MVVRLAGEVKGFLRTRVADPMDLCKNPDFYILPWKKHASKKKFNAILLALTNQLRDMSVGT